MSLCRVLAALLLACPHAVASGEDQEPCLCVFDIDRTLTAKQGTADGACPNTRAVDGITDWAYGGGTFTLSALSALGVNSTFCGGCYLGLCSAGDAGGEDSTERAYLVDHVLVSEPYKELSQSVPSATGWSSGFHVSAPLVVSRRDRTKQFAVFGIMAWYQQQNITINATRTFFFGDRTENIEAFRHMGLNAREVSCASRDLSIGDGMVGLCGATPDEIEDRKGVFTCEDLNYTRPLPPSSTSASSSSPATTGGPTAPAPTTLSPTMRPPQARCGLKYCAERQVCCAFRCHPAGSVCCGMSVCAPGSQCGFGGLFCVPK